jgi:hypothetical protein
VDVTASLTAPCSVPELFALVDDLARYPAWLDLVDRAVPEADSATARPPAWRVDLRAHIGPLARSKRLRMERVEHEPDRGRVRFARRELDGRRHAPWVLTATVESVAGDEPGAMLTMDLHYGGRLWTGGVLERALSEQIRQGRTRLLALVQPTR